jgi:hypothetical protein
MDNFQVGGYAMNEQERIEELKSEHQNLENAIDEEYQRTAPDFAVVSELKRRKLRIKDELVSLAAL